MPTVDEPKMQAPMEAANPAPLQDGKTIVATQPVRHYFFVLWLPRQKEVPSR